MDERLDLSKYQNKKLIAFDLYGTCIDHNFNNIRISSELKEIIKTNPITIQDIQEWKVKKDWVKFQIDNELAGKIRKDIELTFLFPETLDVLKYIKSKWYKTAVVSNLSLDYTEPLNKLIPEWNFDYKVLSFNVWANKPDKKIYEYLKSVSWVDFKDIVMIWDSLKADVIWSNNVWITPIHLNRWENWIKEINKKWIDFIQISTLTDLKEIL